MMKRFVSLIFVFMMCFCLCVCGAEASAVRQWSAQKMVDEFGDPIEGSMPVLQVPFSGEFSNTATAGSELAGYVFMYMMDGYPTFSIRLLEYGDHPATYTSSDVPEFKIKIEDTIIEFHPVMGNPPNGDLMVYDSSETLYTALYNGTDVRCIAYIGSSKYSFTIPADGFADLCGETGYITQALYFSMTDKETLLGRAKEFVDAGDYGKAIEYLEYLGDYEGSSELLKEVVCHAYYYNLGSEYSIDNQNAWQQFFDAATAVALTEEEMQEIIVGEWRTRDGDTYSLYTEDGEYHYYQKGEEKAYFDDVWYTEGGRMIKESKYTRSEYTIYPFLRNVYVFCYHQSGGNVYELYFRNGPLQ